MASSGNPLTVAEQIMRNYAHKPAPKNLMVFAYKGGCSKCNKVRNDIKRHADLAGVRGKLVSVDAHKHRSTIGDYLAEQGVTNDLPAILVYRRGQTNPHTVISQRDMRRGGKGPMVPELLRQKLLNVFAGMVQVGSSTVPESPSFMIVDAKTGDSRRTAAKDIFSVQNASSAILFQDPKCRRCQGVMQTFRELAAGVLKGMRMLTIDVSPNKNTIVKLLDGTGKTSEVQLSKKQHWPAMLLMQSDGTVLKVPYEKMQNREYLQGLIRTKCSASAMPEAMVTRVSPGPSNGQKKLLRAVMNENAIVLMGKFKNRVECREIRDKFLAPLAAKLEQNKQRSEAVKVYTLELTKGVFAIRKAIDDYNDISNMSDSTRGNDIRLDGKLPVLVYFRANAPHAHKLYKEPRFEPQMMAYHASVTYNLDRLPFGDTDMVREKLNGGGRISKSSSSSSSSRSLSLVSEFSNVSGAASLAGGAKVSEFSNVTADSVSRFSNVTGSTVSKFSGVSRANSSRISRFPRDVSFISRFSDV